MRPVCRGVSPQSHDFDPYKDALPHLVGRLGRYCSYCERPVMTQLAVEHIQPKDGPHGHPHLIGRWNNYLLACVNCNSTKGAKKVVLADLLLPDRDNTFVSFTYFPDGTVAPASGLSPALQAKACATLTLMGLDKKICEVRDEYGKLIALDRSSQRMETWLVAEEAKSDIDANPNNQTLRISAVRLAKAQGFFSIWMTVFQADIDMRNRFIDAFEGTRSSGCFNATTTLVVSPAPNPDCLADGAKI